ncbi:hypothetical protein GCM10009767_19860 [Kocuria aegyptia]|uniref:Uncharacterized protein n=1 Tax=Kocuria aegyptia TaxID=330943 RepID=A0ABP4WVQ1_9MICC
MNGRGGICKDVPRQKFLLQHGPRGPWSMVVPRRARRWAPGQLGGELVGGPGRGVLLPDRQRRSAVQAGVDHRAGSLRTATEGAHT